jgi:hypothetical protein
MPSWSEKATQTETWVKVPRLSTTCPRRVVAFDGGKGSIDKTMEFGDDFSGTTLGAQWSLNGTPTISIADGIMDINLGGVINRYLTAGSFGAGYAIRSRTKPVNTSVNNGRVPIGFGYYTSPVTSHFAGVVLYSSGNATIALATLGGTGATYSSTQPVDTAVDYKTEEIRRLSDRVDWVRDGTTRSITSNLPLGNLPVMIGSSYASATTTNRSYVDWIAVRKYTANEPLAGTAQPSATNRALSRPLNHAGLIRAVCA